MRRAALLSFALALTLALEIACRATQRRPDAAPEATLPPATSARGAVTRLTVLDPNGGRVSWTSARDLIAYDKHERNRPYEVHLMRPDGSEKRCLTCGKPSAPAGHKGNPTWHPSGDYLVFQAEKARHPGGSALAAPGRGLHNDLWAMTADGDRYFQLTDLAAGGGVLHPHFSPDGARLLWAERIGPSRTRGDVIGEWAIKLADFVVSGGPPRLQNVRTYQPGGPVFYETHSFSPDGNTVLYSANQETGQTLFGIDIYALDLRTEAVRRLTPTIDEWDEHAQLSPDGRHVVWMSSIACRCKATRSKDLKTEFWIMKPDGSGQAQLTFFNEPRHPHAALSRGKKVAADSAWSPDGKRLVAYVITGIDEGPIVMLELDLTQVPS